MKGPTSPVPLNEPCYSMLLVRPFIARILETPLGSNPLVQKIAAMPDDGRVPVRSVLRWLDAAVQVNGDPDLGLRAVRAWGRGSGDVIELAAASAATMGDALKLVLRYVRILNEAAAFTLEVRGELASLELHSRVALTRPAADFQMGTLMLGARKWLGSIEGFEIWFAHPAPSDLTMYQKTFGPARLRFSAPYDAATFSAALLDSPVASADPALHKVLVRHADQVASSVPLDDALSPRVRKLLLELLPSGESDATRVAQKLGMSRRTLTRHLEREGVTYKDLLEKARHQTALQYLEKSNLDPQQIAFLLGYSVTAAFSRAFARWEGKSPTEHRKAHRTKTSRE